MFGEVFTSSVKLKLAGDLSTENRTLIAVCSLFFFCFVLMRTAWLADDASFTIRSVLNWINGYGPVLNIGERVQAYTHPLWFLVLSLFTLITNNVFFSIFFLSISLSLLNLWILIRCISSYLAGCILAVVALLFSKAFIDYSSSGLENPLAHLFILLSCYYAFVFSKNPSNKHLLFFTFTIALLYLTRQDLILCVMPLGIFIVVKAKKEKLQYVRAIALGLLPAICWLILSLWYYGFPFPNSAYAKLGHEIAMTELITQGHSYFLDSLSNDPLTLVTIVLGLALSIRGSPIEKAISSGIVLYLFYVFLIGGDSMSGRFFTTPLLMACVIISRTPLSSKVAAFISIPLIFLALSNTPATVLSNYSSRGSPLILGNIDVGSELNNGRDNLMNLIDRATFLYPERKSSLEPELAITCKAYPGISKGPALQLVNPCGLSDPLIARLPARQDPTRKMGYFERELPLGYIESVRLGQNVLVDESTRKYYEYIKLIAQGPLLSWDRLKAIILVNLNLIPKPNPYLYQYGSYLLPVAKDEIIYFSKAGLTARNLGWQTHEEWGTWSNGNKARLALSIPNGKINSLHLELRAFIGGAIQCQKVIISINSQIKSESCLSSFENNSILIPLSPADYASGKPLVIDFSLPNAMSPKSIGVSPSDERVLAIGLKQAIFK
jgi:arabinofuranosyltransferase